MVVNIGIRITKKKEKFYQYVDFIKKKLTSKNPVEFHFIESDSCVPDVIPRLNVLLCYRILPDAVCAINKNLKWVHIGNAGIENSMSPQLCNSSVMITNAKGMNAGPASEYVFAQIMYFAKRMSNSIKFHKTGDWKQWEISKNIIQLSGKTIGIIGFGNIGRAIAAKAASFNMKILAVDKFVKKEDKYLAEKIFTIRKINELLINSDFVVLSVPLTFETKGLLSEKEFHLMKESAHLVNVSRGGVIHEGDLINALKNNWIAGAAIDVFEKEPPDKNNPLFKLENVFLSPHLAGNYPEFQDDMVSQFCDNLDRLLCGKPLLNKVDKMLQF